MVVTLLVVAKGGAVSAQSVSGDLRNSGADANIFRRDRAETVRERPRPDYEALGLPAGAFTLYPKVQIDTEFNDNVLAADGFKQDDVLVRVSPEVNLRSNWSRAALDMFARAAVVRYNEVSSEDATDWRAGAVGRVDVSSRATVNGGADYGRATEPRTSSNTAVLAAEPIRYDLGQAYVGGAFTANRLKLSGRGDFRTYDYEDGFTDAGVVIDQDNRDRDFYAVTGRADYAISPATAIFAQLSGNERDYTADGPSPVPARDSSGYQALAGANFELGALVRGEIAGGYISQEFDDPAYQAIDGFGGRAEIVWLPTQLTTVMATGSRTIEDAGVIGAGGYVSSAAGLQIDHELLRNVILTGTLNFSRDAFEGIDRDDDRLSVGLSGTYLINRRLGVTVGYSRLDLSSDGADAGVEYAVNRLTLSLVTQF